MYDDEQRLDNCIEEFAHVRRPKNLTEYDSGHWDSVAMVVMRGLHELLSRVREAKAWDAASAMKPERERLP